MISRDERREAEDRIARLIFAYCSRLDAADFEGMASLFENGTWHIDPETVRHGRDEVRAWLEETLIVYGDKLGTRHIISNIVTDVADDGQTAVSSSYVHVTQVTEDFPLQLISQARYQDSFAKTDGDWHFVDRTVLSDGAGDMSHHRRDWQRSGSTSV
jgi:3-phenylpropionate/cinnamic acid dioxygenase small subunit